MTLPWRSGSTAPDLCLQRGRLAKEWSDPLSQRAGFPSRHAKDCNQTNRFLMSEGGVTPEDSREAAHELADLELIGDHDAVVIAALLRIAPRFAHEVCHVERDEGSSAGDGKVKLLTVGR